MSNIDLHMLEAAVKNLETILIAGTLSGPETEKQQQFWCSMQHMHMHNTKRAQIGITHPKPMLLQTT